MADILNYEMTAYAQKDHFNVLQSELKAAYQNSGFYPLKRILQLFPLNTPNIRDILKRSPLQFSLQDQIAFTDYDDDQVLAFGDEALGQVYITVPSHLSSSIEMNDLANSFILTVNETLIMQLNVLTQQGVNRSAFQQVKSIQLTDNIITTTLVDVTSPSSITNLIVYLTEDNNIRMHNNDTLILLKFLEKSNNHIHTMSWRSLSGSSCCDQIYGTAWYVYKKTGDNSPDGEVVCQVQQSTCNSPGKDWTIVHGGFDTEQQADDALNSSTICQH